MKLKQVYSDKAQLSAIVNIDMPVMIQFDVEEDTENVKAIVFNFQIFSIPISFEGKVSYELKKALDDSYIHFTSQGRINLDEVISNALKKA